MPRTVTQIQFPTPIPKARRVAAYARVSSDKDTMLHSLAAQVDYYSTYIRHHPGWAYVGVYADEAKTGTRDSRENFQRMLADCRAGKIDHIITKSVSRFSRNTVILLETIRELKGLGISVYFEEQSIDTATDDGELMLSILASYAQEESLSASENQKWRVRRNFEQGIPWRFFMLGYRGENGKLVVVPEEADIVRGIFRDYLDGKGTAAIVKRLNEEGYATQSGCVFPTKPLSRRKPFRLFRTRSSGGRRNTHLPSHGNSPCLPALSPVPSAANTIAAKPPPRDRSGSVPPTIPTGKPTAPPKPSRKKS